jgi:hypothetical protein
MTSDEGADLNRASLDTMNSELDRQQSGYSGRSNAMNSRAALLVASASIATGLQVADVDPWAILAALAAATGAILGLIGLWPRSGPELDIADLENATCAMTDDETLRYAIYARLYILRADEAMLVKRAQTVKIGFGFLAAAAALAALHVLFSAFASQIQIWLPFVHLVPLTH